MERKLPPNSRLRDRERPVQRHFSRQSWAASPSRRKRSRQPYSAHRVPSPERNSARGKSNPWPSDNLCRGLQLPPEQVLHPVAGIPRRDEIPHTPVAFFLLGVRYRSSAFLTLLYLSLLVSIQSVLLRWLLWS